MKKQVFNSKGKKVTVSIPEKEALMQVKKSDLEECRQDWSETAKRHGWYKEPFYVQLFLEGGEVVDSVSYQGITKDLFVCNNTDQLIEVELVDTLQ